MKIKNVSKVLIFYLFIFHILSSAYAQDVELEDSTVIDTNRIPFLLVETSSFLDSLKIALKNSLSYQTESENDTLQIAVSHFFSPQQENNFNELSRTKPVFDWFFAISLLFLALLAFIRLLSPGGMLVPFQQILRGKKTSKFLLRREISVKKIVLFSLVISSWIGFSLAINELFLFLNLSYSYGLLLLSFVTVFIYFSAKYILYRISGWIFEMNHFVSEYVQIQINTSFFTALLCFPLAIVNHYCLTNYLVWVIFFVLGISFIQKIIFEWIIFRKKLGIMEILLYLCTVELVPFFLLIKYILNQFYNL